MKEIMSEEDSDFYHVDRETAQFIKEMTGVNIEIQEGEEDVNMCKAWEDMAIDISETAKLNNLRPYFYFRYILTELAKHCDEKGNIDPAELDYLMPWSESLPEECRKPRRS